MKKAHKYAGTKQHLQPMARRIQDAMALFKLDVSALTEQLGLAKSQRGAVNNWVIGRNGVSDAFRAKLASTLQIPEDELLAPLGPDAPRNARTGRTPSIVGPAQRAVILARELPPAPSMPVASDVFVIRARSDGTMQVKLDASLPWAKGSQLIQYLLSFGLVIGAEAEGD